MKVTNVDILVIGAGQAGLATGYFLKKAQCDFLIVDGAKHVGASWLSRWDSLRLFTPRQHSSLPGLKLPHDTDYYPSKYQIAKYLKQYAENFELPIRMNCLVSSLTMKNAIFEADIGKEKIVARRVIIAAGAYPQPYTPDCSSKLGDKVEQMHSSQYKNSSQFRAGRVTVIGGGNSASQIAQELVATKQVALISRKPLKYIPDKIAGLSFFTYLTTTRIIRAGKTTPIGRRLQRTHDVIVGKGLQDIIRHAKIRHFCSQVVDATKTTLMLQDGTKVPVEAVIWATGFRTVYPWVHIPGALDTLQRPLHTKGVSPVDGLFWVGLPWQTSLDSAHLHGVGEDARRMVSIATS